MPILTGESGPRLLRGVAAAVAVATACWGLSALVRRLRRAQQIRVDALYVYPIKGCRGHAVDGVKMTPWGFEGDRLYMVVNSKLEWVSQRSLPRMALIHPDLVTEQGVTLRAVARAGATGAADVPAPLFVPVAKETPNNSCTVLVWEDKVPAVDQGDAAAKWLQNRLGKDGLRLVRISGMAHRKTDPQFGAGETSFSDGFPVLLTSQASMEDVNSRVPGMEVHIDRFRTNVHVSGCRAWEEEEMPAINLAGGRFSLVKPCARCSVPNNDPLTGKKTDSGGEPMTTLRRFRSGWRLALFARLHRAHFSRNRGEAFFGMNAHVAFPEGARLSVGDIGTIQWHV